MLLNYGAKNFSSFKEGVNVSFQLNEKCPVAISRGRKVSNILCVKGANSSGKTQLLKILGFLKYFCVDSFSLKPEAQILVDSYYRNDQPIEFYVEFQIDSELYLYELSLTCKEVLLERISRKIKKTVVLIERKKNRITRASRELKKIKQISIRSNASIISTSRQHLIESLDNIYHFFKNIICNVNYYGLSQSPDHNAASEFYKNSPATFNFVKNKIRQFDPDIEDIEIRKRKNDDKEILYFPVFIHSVSSTKKETSYSDESSGTRSLFCHLGLYFHVLTYGGVLVLDEFDINLHPDILPELISWFLSDETNPHNAQMIFTTHNTEIMDLTGKYRTILVQKENNESFAYRLDEIPGDILRNDRPISPIYKSGKIGGVPVL